MSLKEYFELWKAGILDVVKSWIIATVIMVALIVLFLILSFFPFKVSVAIFGILMVFGFLPILVGWAKTEEEQLYYSFKKKEVK